MGKNILVLTGSPRKGGNSEKWRMRLLRERRRRVIAL